MKVKMRIEREFDIKTLKVKAGVRYWEDSTLNGVEDDETNPKMPFVENGNWCPVIDIDTGIIQNWPEGQTARIHYKVCDAGTYTVLDNHGEVIFHEENIYVPKILYPEGDGYADYIIMNINEKGVIDKWKAHHIQELLEDRN